MGDGFTTRAIRAATRMPRLDQPTSSVPIYQTVTFFSADAADLRADVETVLEAARATFVVADAATPTAATA